LPADHVADATEAVSLEAAAIRLGAVLLIMPAVPARPGSESCPDPVGMWRQTDMPVGPSLIVAGKYRRASPGKLNDVTTISRCRRI